MLGAGEDPGKTWEDQEMPRGCPGDVRGRDGGVGTVINLTDPLFMPGPALYLYRSQDKCLFN